MNFLVDGLNEITLPMIAMWVIGALLIFLAIKFNMEPALLLPMGFGAIMINLPKGIPVDGVTHIIDALYMFGIDGAEAFPLLLFIGIGAMIDFGPLLSNPKLLFFGAAAQFGIFFTVFVAAAIGKSTGMFSIEDAAAIGIIGAADGPTSILVANVLNSKFIGAITVAAYSYMALVPLVQPVAIKMVTTKADRAIKMPYNPKNVSKLTRILFPIFVTVIAGLIAPMSATLVGFLMFGNLIRECGVLNTMSETAQKILANLITLLLGITIAHSMKADEFITWGTLIIIALGLVAFVIDTMAGVLFAKFINLFSKNKVNPMIGAAGISAFPMSARVVQKLGLEADPSNHLLMHAVGANVSGQIASVIAGGALLSIVLGFKEVLL